ncbi:MAG TPA: 2'-5' RNA ligase family protein, partial [Thermomicrobiales bacterium]|nr:2'-5' RNA ligase family protein [Thermomicrobiales bacterium]
PILYLAPDPVDPFRELIERFRREFPAVPPYWDRFDEVVPHVTVADAAYTGDAAGFDRLAERIQPLLPISCMSREVALIQRIRPAPAPWDITGTFALGS